MVYLREDFKYLYLNDDIVIAQNVFPGEDEQWYWIPL